MRVRIRCDYKTIELNYCHLYIYVLGEYSHNGTAPSMSEATIRVGSGRVGRFSFDDSERRGK